MSIAKDGFLSDDVAQWIERYRSEHATAFGLAKAMNRTGEELMLSAQLTMRAMRSTRAGSLSSCL